MPRYDWDYYRDRYVMGDVTLADLATLPNAPALDTLKRRSARERWPAKREAYRHQTATKTQEAVGTTEAEVAARHVPTGIGLDRQGQPGVAQDVCAAAV